MGTGRRRRRRRRRRSRPTAAVAVVFHYNHCLADSLRRRTGPILAVRERNLARIALRGSIRTLSALDHAQSGDCADAVCDADMLGEIPWYEGLPSARHRLHDAEHCRLCGPVGWTGECLTCRLRYLAAWRSEEVVVTSLES